MVKWALKFQYFYGNVCFLNIFILFILLGWELFHNPIARCWKRERKRKRENIVDTGHPFGFREGGKMSRTFQDVALYISIWKFILFSCCCCSMLMRAYWIIYCIEFVFKKVNLRERERRSVFFFFFFFPCISRMRGLSCPSPCLDIIARLIEFPNRTSCACLGAFALRPHRPQ